MPRGISKKVKIRMKEVARLLRIRGCVLARAVVELGFSKMQAVHALERVGVRVYVGNVRMWCYSRRSAVKHLRRLRSILHGLICAAGAKYVTPEKALMLIAGDKAAKKIFSRYVRVDARDTGALQFLNGLLRLTYGEPVILKRRKQVYFADCRKKQLPLPPSVRGQKEYRSVQVRVEPGLREALIKAAEAEGVSVSALVRRALERLLAKYKALELKNRVETHERAEAC